MKQQKPTPEESIAMEITDEFTKEMIDANIRLIEAVDIEDYTTAARERDFIKLLIDQTVSMVTMYIKVDTDLLTNHFQQNNEYAYNELYNKFKEL